MTYQPVNPVDQRIAELRGTIPFYEKHESVLWDAWLQFRSMMTYTTYYEWSKRRAELVAELAELEKQYPDPLPAYTDLGGYPIIYIANDCETLCGSCAAHEPTEVTAMVHYEGHSIFCDECNHEIESAYGVPELADCDDPLLNL